MSETRGRRILLVTSDADLAMQIGRLVDTDRYEVEPCPDATQALVYFQMDPCSAVLVDCAVEGKMSAHALCHALRELSSEVVLIGIGPKSVSQADEEVFRLLGADAFLRLPVTASQLFGAIRVAGELLGKRAGTAYSACCPACGTTHRVLVLSLAKRQWRAQCPNCNYLFRVDPDKPAHLPLAENAYAPPRGRVLVVDDTRFFRLFLYELLSTAGFRVVLAESGREGLELAQRWGPDVAVIDITMPGMDGLELLRRLKGELGPDGPAVVVATSFATPEYRRAAEEAGADGYVLKPIAPEAFVAQVARLAQQRRQPCEVATTEGRLA